MTQRRRRPANRRPWRKPRRRLNPLVLLMPVALLALWLTLDHYVFLVRRVEVVGSQTIAEADVVRASGIRLGSRLRTLDVNAIQTSVDATGALAFVDVKPRYPVTVRLTVRERSHDAVILQAGKLLVLDSDGYVISANDTLPAQSIPYVTGLKPNTYRLGKQLDATPARLNGMKAVLEALKARGATGYASELDVEYPADLRILTRTGMTVQLGTADDMDQKIAWMAGALKDLESRGETLGRLDVSSGKRADYLPMVIATPTPAPTQNLYLLNTSTPEPTPEPTPEAGAVIGEDAI